VRVMASQVRLSSRYFARFPQGNVCLRKDRSLLAAGLFLCLLDSGDKS
jgi:hypothetical protein